MELFLLQQDICTGYDTYDSVIVCAENEEEARKIHPSKSVTHVKNGNWMVTCDNGWEYEDVCDDWVEFKDIDKIKVTHIGTAVENQKKGVILASFNAG